MSEMIPLFNNVVLTLEKTKDETVGGIIISNEVKPLPQGTVMAHGPGSIDNPMLVSVGQRVLYNLTAKVSRVPSAEGERLVIDQSEILGILPAE